MVENVDKEKPMFPISVLADILQVHQRTLRIYDKYGILTPKRSSKGRRLYSVNDIERGKLIQFMTSKIGMNVVSVKIISELKPNLTLEDLEKMAKDLALNTGRELKKRGRKKKNG